MIIYLIGCMVTMLLATIFMNFFRVVRRLVDNDVKVMISIGIFWPFFWIWFIAVGCMNLFICFETKRKS